MAFAPLGPSHSISLIESAVYSGGCSLDIRGILSWRGICPSAGEVHEGRLLGFQLFKHARPARRGATLALAKVNRLLVFFVVHVACWPAPESLLKLELRGAVSVQVG